MSIKHVRLLAALSVLFLGRNIRGQNPEAESVKGEIAVGSNAPVHAEVTLSDIQGGRTIASAPLGSDGRFELRHVPDGQYRLTVLDSDSRPIHIELIAIHDRQLPIQVQVTPREQPRPASGTVSARELLHPPDKKAVKAFEASRRLSLAGDHEEAARQLEKVVRLAPEYANAWTNLGAQHIYLKRYQLALQELAHASQISRPTSTILGNMAYAQYALHRYAEGTGSAREALRLNPSSAPAHYLLGSFLVRDGRTRAEGILHLEAAARSMPAARAELERARQDSAQVVSRP